MGNWTEIGEQLQVNMKDIIRQGEDQVSFWDLMSEYAIIIGMVSYQFSMYIAQEKKCIYFCEYVVQNYKVKTWICRGRINFNKNVQKQDFKSHSHT